MFNVGHSMLNVHSSSSGLHRAKAFAAMDDEIELPGLRQMDEIALDGFHNWSFFHSIL